MIFEDFSHPKGLQGRVYLVGGAVRDIIMNLTPKDRDYVVIGGSQENLLSLGFKQVGESFPVFLHPETGEEYALARTERKTGTGYGGFEVITEGVTLEQDLGRRDFTCNAMAMSSSGFMYDPFNGARDIRSGVLHATTDSFKDDPLRALRAARFAARYEWIISPFTCNAIRMIAQNDLDAISPERIYLEFSKAMTDGKFGFFLERLNWLELEWLEEKILCTIPVGIGRYVDPKNIDASWLSLCAIALDFSAKLANFPMLAMHRELANWWHEYKITLPSHTALARLLGRLGKPDSAKFKLLVNALDLQNPQQSHDWLFDAANLYHEINAETVLKDDPTLSGPALGKAIFDARANALRMHEF